MGAGLQELSKDETLVWGNNHPRKTGPSSEALRRVTSSEEEEQGKSEELEGPGGKAGGPRGPRGSDVQARKRGTWDMRHGTERKESGRKAVPETVQGSRRIPEGRAQMRA